MLIPEDLAKEQLVAELSRLRERICELEQACTGIGGASDEELIRAKAMYEGLFEFSPDAIIVVHHSGIVMEANKQAANLFGYSKDEFVDSEIEMLLPDRFREGHRKYREEYMCSPGIRPMGTGTEFYGRKKDGVEFFADISLGPVKLSEGIAVIAVIRDISTIKKAGIALQRAYDELEEKVRERTAQLVMTTEILEAENKERKKAMKEVKKINRALRVLSSCNRALVHAIDYELFLNEICRIVVDDGQYLMAWIGFPQMNGGKTVRPVASAGRVGNYLDKIKVTYEDDEWGRGPMGVAIRTGEVCVRNDMLTDARFAPWATEAAAMGFASSIGLPLKANEEQCFGALAIYAAEKDIFIEEEEKLLMELADNISFGIRNLQIRTQNRLAEQKLEKSYEQLRKLAGHLQSIREEERTNIARDLHDEIGQLMTAIKMDVAWLRDKYSDHDGIHEKTSSTLTLINTSIKSMKKICTALRPEILDHLGLGAAIEWQANEFRQRSGIECEVILNAEAVLDKERSTAFFRIFQEALTNIHRHSRAKKVEVTVTEQEDEIMLQISDDGIGITEAQLSKANSFGLLGMRERVNIFNGKLVIKGSPNNGTAITVLIPR